MAPLKAALLGIIQFRPSWSRYVALFIDEQSYLPYWDTARNTAILHPSNYADILAAFGKSDGIFTKHKNWLLIDTESGTAQVLPKEQAYKIMHEAQKEKEEDINPIDRFSAVFGEQKLYYTAEAAERAGREWIGDG